VRRAIVALAVSLAAATVTSACTTPTGSGRNPCGAEWLGRQAVAAAGAGIEEAPLLIECIEAIGESRVRVGFSLPSGPDCHLLSRIELVESADSLSITLFGAVSDDPSAGACADEARRVLTEIELQAPVGQRSLLDGSP